MCHVSMRHSISIVRSVLHVCKCGGIRFDSGMGSGLDCRAPASHDCGLRGLVSRRLYNYNFGRVLGGSLAHSTCCSGLSACPISRYIVLVGPLDTSLGYVHRALLFKNLRDIRRGTGHGGNGVHFFRFKGYCSCGVSRGGRNRALTRFSRSCHLNL